VGGTSAAESVVKNTRRVRGVSGKRSLTKGIIDKQNIYKPGLGMVSKGDILGPEEVGKIKRRKMEGKGRDCN